MESTPKVGRPPINGQRALSKAERQQRYRKKAAETGTAKVQITITLDPAVAAMIDLTAEHIFHASRNETIRILLQARLAQLREMMDVMELVEDSFSPKVFEGSLHQVRDKHAYMLRGSMCIHDVKQYSQKHLEQLESALKETIGKYKEIPTDHVEKMASEVADLRVSLNEPI